MEWKKGAQVQVLDKGYVKLIDWMGSDETIIDAARMSVEGGFISWDPYSGHPAGDLGLLEFLLKNHHTTPFEMCELCIEVQAPIFVFREWHRHRTQSYNELSARYTQMPNLHYVPSAERLRAVKSANKQEASKYEGVLDPEEALALVAKEQQDLYTSYDFLLERGVPKEVARINTPVSRYSRMRAKTDLLNWLRFLGLRQPSSAQWEIRQYANVVGDIASYLFPRSYKLYDEWWLNAVSFGKTEMAALIDAINRMSIGAEELRTAARAVGMNERHVTAFMAKLHIK